MSKIISPYCVLIGDNARAIGNDFFAAVQANGDLSAIEEEITDLVDLYGGNATLVGPLLDSAALIYSQISNNLTETEKSVVRGNMADAALLALEAALGQPEIENLNHLVSFLTLQGNTELFETAQTALRDIADVIENPSFGAQFLENQENLIERLSNFAALADTAFYDLKADNCKYQEQTAERFFFQNT